MKKRDSLSKWKGKQNEEMREGRKEGTDGPKQCIYYRQKKKRTAKINSPISRLALMSAACHFHRSSQFINSCFAHEAVDRNNSHCPTSQKWVTMNAKIDAMIKHALSICWPGGPGAVCPGGPCILLIYFSSFLNQKFDILWHSVECRQATTQLYVWECVYSDHSLPRSVYLFIVKMCIWRRFGFHQHLRLFVLYSFSSILFNAFFVRIGIGGVSVGVCVCVRGTAAEEII